MPLNDASLRIIYAFVNATLWGRKGQLVNWSCIFRVHGQNFTKFGHQNVSRDTKPGADPGIYHGGGGGGGGGGGQVGSGVTIKVVGGQEHN